VPPSGGILLNGLFISETCIVDMVIRISSVTRDRLPPISGFKIQPADEITLNVGLFRILKVVLLV